MSTLHLSTRIRAPIERCFDLARSVDVHIASTAATRERVVGGVMRGLMELGDEVTWRARHLGVEQELTARITAFNRPTHFRDSMVRGAFRRFDHDHRFAQDGDVTTMIDLFDFDAPLGVLGIIADRLFLADYMRRFLDERAQVIKRVAESDEWRRYLED